MSDEHLEPLRNIVVRGNTIEDPHYCGVFLRNSGGKTIVEGNIIENSAGVLIDRDIANDRAAKILIRNNTVTMRERQLEWASLELHE